MKRMIKNEQEKALSHLHTVNARIKLVHTSLGR